MSAPTESRWGKLGEMPHAAWLLPAAWLAGSLLWIAYWVNYFYGYCDFNGTFACVLGGFLETVFYSVPEALARVLGPPALALILGLAAHRAVKARAGRAHPRRRERLGIE
jgi:hypothetical protein